MKKTNKKGFTLVELVIVIAVIAILAAVLIPTFATIIDKANRSKAMQEARNAFEAYLADNAETLVGTEDFMIKSGNYWYKVEDLQFSAKEETSAPVFAAFNATSYAANTYVQVADGSAVYQLQTTALTPNNP